MWNPGKWISGQASCFWSYSPGLASGIKTLVKRLADPPPLGRPPPGKVHTCPKDNTPLRTTLPCGETDTCENITLPQSSFEGGNYTSKTFFKTKRLTKQESIPVGCQPHACQAYNEQVSICLEGGSCTGGGRAMYSEVQVEQVWTHLGEGVHVWWGPMHHG